MDRGLWQRHVEYLDKFLKRASHADEAARLGIAGKLERARKMREETDSPEYLKQLSGTIGAETIDNYL